MTVFRYQGIDFPTLVHAQWAFFFDDLRLPWRFRCTTVELSGGPFQPDFWLPTTELWLHVSARWDDHEYRRWQEFAAAADGTPCPARDHFTAGAPCAQHGRHTIAPLWDQWPARHSLYSVGAIPSADEVSDTVATGPQASSMISLGDGAYQWTRCPTCGVISAEYEGRADRLACGHGDSSRDGNRRADDPRLLAAYRLARLACPAELHSICARCAVPFRKGDLICAGRRMANRKWHHADCLLATLRERYPAFESTGQVTPRQRHDESPTPQSVDGDAHVGAV